SASLTSVLGAAASYTIWCEPRIDLLSEGYHPVARRRGAIGHIVTRSTEFAFLVGVQKDPAIARMIFVLGGTRPAHFADRRAVLVAGRKARRSIQTLPADGSATAVLAMAINVVRVTCVIALTTMFIGPVEQYALAITNHVIILNRFADRFSTSVRILRGGDDICLLICRAASTGAISVPPRWLGGLGTGHDHGKENDSLGFNAPHHSPPCWVQQHRTPFGVNPGKICSPKGITQSHAAAGPSGTL